MTAANARDAAAASKRLVMDIADRRALYTGERQHDRQTKHVGVTGRSVTRADLSGIEIQ